MIAIRKLAAILTYAIGFCGMLPLLPWLSTFPRMVLACGIVSGLWQERRGIWQLKPWMQNVVIVPVFVYYAVQFSRSNPAEPVVSVLAIMLAVRLGGEKTVRHSQQIYALSLFCLASSSLFDLSPVFLIYLGFLLFMIALALVLLTFHDQNPVMMVSKTDLKRILFSGIVIPILAVPLLLFFFPIMPRTQMPLWDFLSPPASRTSGYSDAVQPGSQSSLTESHTLAFRAEMNRQPQPLVYWRGTVFNSTDGKKWTRSNQIPVELTIIVGSPVSQTIYQEPSARRTLFALDRPADLARQRISKSADGVFELWRLTGKRVSYTAESQSSGVIQQRNPINKSFYLQLPDQIPDRVQALAGKITRPGKDARAKVELLENYFRNGNYRYSTKELATGENALELFLFDKKQGHCEFFASSFALLLRLAGVPCRLVGGYLGGEYNQLGGYYIVTEDKAHVWVEAYIDGSGWVRIDPSVFATNAGDVWTNKSSRSLMAQATLAFDSFNHLWNRLVITYDFEQQMNAVSRISSQIQAINPATIVRSLLPYGAGTLLLAGILFAVRRSSLFLSREERVLRSFLRSVERKFNISTGEGSMGLFELSVATDNEHVSEFVTIYAEAVYHDRRLTDEEYRRLQQLLGVLKGISNTNRTYNNN
ncbi:MAG: transglutaminaseTgpA domain-containing protein [Desulfuromonadaceae bacterium]